MNASGGLPSGPFHAGPPTEVVSTNNDLRGLINAIGRATAMVRVIGVTTTEIARKKRTINDG
jgi:hypothetical protein